VNEEHGQDEHEKQWLPYNQIHRIIGKGVADRGYQRYAAGKTCDAYCRNLEA
jgi:hypothetical protein